MNLNETVVVASRSFSKNDYLISELKQHYSHIILNETGKTLQEKELLEFLRPADKAIIGIEEISNSLLDNLPNLKVISKYGVGLDNISLDSLRDKGIRLGFTPGVNKQSVAELALTLTLISLRKIHTNHIEILQGEWPQEKGSELYGKKIGLLGFGNIGQKFAALLQPFNCKILFFDKKKFKNKELTMICKESAINPSQIQQEEFLTVLKNSDILSLHLPLFKEAENLISLKEMKYLKDNVSIVNTARGGIINESDLFNFLFDNKNAFAAFDVFVEEPVIDNPLFQLPNFFGTSHRSSLTYEGINSMGLAAITGLDDNIIPT